MFRRMSDHDLTQFLAQRISLEELQRANVVEDVLTWINIPTTGTIPRPRNCHTANIMKNKEGHEEMFVLGGFGTGSASLELLRLNLCMCSVARRVYVKKKFKTEFARC